MIYGLGSKDDLKFKFDIRIDGTIVSSSGWQAIPEANLATPASSPAMPCSRCMFATTMRVAPCNSTDAILQSTKPLSLGPAALPKSN